MTKKRKFLCQRLKGEWPCSEICGEMCIRWLSEDCLKGYKGEEEKTEHGITFREMIDKVRELYPDETSADMMAAVLVLAQDMWKQNIDKMLKSQNVSRNTNDREHRIMLNGFMTGCKCMFETTVADGIEQNLEHYIRIIQEHKDES